MLRTVLILFMLLLFSSAGPTFAEWRVELESKTVGAGQTDVTLGVTASWDQEINTLVIPVAVRALTPGSFWTGDLPYDTMNAPPHRVAWHWDKPNWPELVLEVRPALPCSLLVDEYDGISPDYFVVLVAGITGNGGVYPSGKEVLTLEFDVTTHPGQFVFDTACVAIPTAMESIYIVDTEFPPVDHGPLGTGECSFAPGVVTITECDCTAQGDCNDNGIIDVTDCIYLIDYALRDGPAPPSDPLCPIMNRGDWNCDGKINLVDIARMIRFIIGASAEPPCDMCPK